LYYATTFAEVGSVRGEEPNIFKKSSFELLPVCVYGSSFFVVMPADYACEKEGSRIIFDDVLISS